MWNDLINHTENISTLMVELAKIRLHWKIFLYFPGIRSMLMDKNWFYHKTSMQRYKYICVLVKTGSIPRFPLFLSSI